MLCISLKSLNRNIIYGYIENSSYLAETCRAANWCLQWRCCLDNYHPEAWPGETEIRSFINDVFTALSCFFFSLGLLIKNHWGGETMQKWSWSNEGGWSQCKEYEACAAERLLTPKQWSLSSGEVLISGSPVCNLLIPLPRAHCPTEPCADSSGSSSG